MLTKKTSARVPSYRHHKPTGQAVVTLSDQPGRIRSADW